ncbi:hypothetical protein D9613_012227 [Agrocybe pediades]|uniref:Uncharacterized protein n=1 Tax=Agrocybe pediades TaxID=84607 RepID=A0A8H4VIW4_9AGAR|nr:hypothetical protein D9613_012227 [Agrocybe pediades]
MVEVKQKCLDLSNAKGFTARFPLLDRPFLPVHTSFKEELPVTDKRSAVGRVICPIGYKKVPTGSGTWRALGFPRGSKGVFYYHKSVPEISSSIRFRICEDPTPSSFQAGQDLLLPSTDYGERLPWKIPLLSIATKKTHRAFQQTLLDEGLVDRSVLEALRRLESPNIARVKEPLYSIDQPFVVDLSQRIEVNFVTLKGHVGPMQFDVFGLERLYPFSGKVRMCFVLSPLPEHRHVPSLLLQCLEIITPMKRVCESDIIEAPVVEEYFQRSGRIWSYSLKGDNGKEIAEIFDIEV